MQTLRLNLQRRLDSAKETTDEWTKHVKNIVNKYDNTIHNITQIEQNSAKLPSNFLYVAWHLNAAVKNRKYLTILPNGKVRVNIKPKPGITKGHHPTYPSTNHKAISVKENDYLIDIMNKKKQYYRHELLLVK